MPIGLLFWMLMVLWVALWGWGWYGGPAWGHFPLLFVLLFLLGWHDFGFIVK